MVRGFAIGVFVSAALTLVMFKLISTRGTAPEHALVAPKAAPGAPEVDPAKELEKTTAINAGLQKQIDEAKAAVAKPPDTAAVAKKEPAANPWSTIARKLVAFLKEVKAAPGKQPERGQDMMMEMIALTGSIGKKYGVGMDEAMLTPEGLPALICAALEDADPPLTDAERAAMEAALADCTAGWEALQKDKEGKSKLEMRLEMTRNSLSASDAFKAALSPDHVETVGTMQAMGMGISGGIGSGFYHARGTADEVKVDFSKQWAKVLKLDPSQATLLEPIVDEYLGACDLSTSQFGKSLMAGQKGGESAMMLGKLEAQIKAQKRIAESLSLTPSQQKALKGWATTYSYSKVLTSPGSDTNPTGK